MLTIGETLVSPSSWHHRKQLLKSAIAVISRRGLPLGKLVGNERFHVLPTGARYLWRQSLGLQKTTNQRQYLRGGLIVWGLLFSASGDKRKDSARAARVGDRTDGFESTLTPPGDMKVLSSYPLAKAVSRKVLRDYCL